MKARITAIVLFLFSICICSAQHSIIRSFSADQDLPDPYVYSLIQDREGFLWVSTGRGLAKFDGQFFRKMTTGVAEEEMVYASAIQKDGTLWFGTFSGKLLSYDGTAFSLFPKDCKASINRILPGKKDGELVLNTRGGGIFLKQGDQLTQLAGSDAYMISDIATCGSGLLAATSEGLFFVDIMSQTFTRLNLEGGEVTHIRALEHKANTFIISTAGGIVEAEIRPGAQLAVKRQLASLQQFPGGVKAFDYLEEKEILYAAGGDERLRILHTLNHSTEPLSETEFLAGVTCFYRDAEQNIWIGTAGKGLYRVSLAPFTVTRLGTTVYAITCDEAGNTYYGTASGIQVFNRTGAAEKRIEKVGSRTLGKVTALYCRGDKLWIGMEEQGLLVIQPGSQKDVTPEFSDIPNISVNAITGRDAYVSVATNLEGVFNYENGKLREHFSVKNSLLHNNVYYSLMAGNQKIYYATHNTSFNHSLGSQLYEIDMKPLGLISEFNCFSEDRQGTIAVATNGDGIYLIKDTTIKPFERDEELETKFCESVVYDRDDNLWIAGRYNLYKYYPKEQVLSRIRFSEKGAEMLIPRAFYRDTAGDLYFGTNEGVIHFTAGRSAGSIPRPYLVSLRVRDSVMPGNAETHFPSGSYHLVFEFSALGLTSSEDITFMYKLEGRDEHWSEPSSLRKAEFSRLGEGNYTLKVIALNSEGFSSPETAVYHFSIAPPLWKRPLFWALVLVLLVVAVFLVVKMRTAALIRTKEQLEAQVAEKTKELREEKELVEEKNKRIKAQNREIKDSITYARRIQDALLPDKELLAEKNKNIFVLYQPRDIVSGDFYWLAERGHLKIIVAADCTGHGVPGALMSMIGSTLLNKIILEKKVTRPKEILRELDREVKLALKQHREEATRDGMDISLCVLDTHAKTLTYAGAMRPMMLVRERQLTEYAPTKHAIGGFSYGSDKVFEETEISLQGNEMFYLFSDGYADQFGGDKGKKLMLKNFKKILISISDMELEKQEENLRRVYNNWKGELDQVDDVLVIGVRV